MKRWLIIGGTALVVLAAAVYLYVNQPHRSVAGEDAIDVDAAFLFQSFQGNEASANEKYLNKVLRVHGKVSTTDKNADGMQVVVLETGDMMFGINCTLQKEYPLKAGDEVTIRGICTGYLSDVVLTQGIFEP